MGDNFSGSDLQGANFSGADLNETNFTKANLRNANMTSAGRALDPNAVTLAVAASVRHCETGYDQLLMSGIPRAQAREQVRSEIQRVLDVWRAPDSEG